MRSRELSVGGRFGVDYVDAALCGLRSFDRLAGYPLARAESVVISCAKAAGNDKDAGNRPAS
jgi:hypothetical protein